jgi:hypothetical protein
MGRPKRWVYGISLGKTLVKAPENTLKKIGVEVA